MDEYYSGFFDRSYEGDQLETLLPDLLWSDEGLDVGEFLSTDTSHLWGRKKATLHMEKQRCDRDYIGV